jgi:hypothetical protein
VEASTQGAPATRAMQECAGALASARTANDTAAFEKCYRRHGGTGALTSYSIERA